MLRILVLILLLSLAGLPTVFAQESTIQQSESIQANLLYTQIAYTLATVAIFTIGLIFGHKQWKSQRTISQLQERLTKAEETMAKEQQNTAVALKKSHESQLLLHLFETLSSLEMTNSRKEIFEQYCSIYGNNRMDTKEKRERLLINYQYIKDDVRIVENAFDQAGVLVIYEAVSPKLFFELYALMVIRTYRALQVHIEKEQEKSPAFAYWFKKLYDEALRYYRTEKKSEPPEIYCDAEGNG